MHLSLHPLIPFTAQLSFVVKLARQLSVALDCLAGPKGASLGAPKEALEKPPGGP